MFLFKKLFSSTILGLTLGIFLVAYVVFAYTPPTQAPPGGNVPTPLNTSSVDQTKTGGTLNVFGLWVNQSLGVTGGATLGGILNLQGNRITNVGAPSSAGDVATKGFVDSATSNLQTRVSSSCLAGQGIRAIATDGSVACESVGAQLNQNSFFAGEIENAGTNWTDLNLTYFGVPKVPNIPTDAKQWFCNFNAPPRVSSSGACATGQLRLLCNGSSVVWSGSFSSIWSDQIVNYRQTGIQSLSPASCVFQAISNCSYAGFSINVIGSCPYVK